MALGEWDDGNFHVLVKGETVQSRAGVLEGLFKRVEWLLWKSIPYAGEGIQ